MTILKEENTKTFLSYSIFGPRRLLQSAGAMGKFGENSWRGTDDPFAESLEEVFTEVTALTKP